MDNLATRCPLCNGSSVLTSERIPVERVVSRYKRLLGIDINDEFSDLLSIDYNRCSECDLGYFFPLVSGSEHFYKKLQKFSWYYMDEKNEYGFAQSFVNRTDNILEIGCGKGAFAKLVHGRSYLGLEFSKEAQYLATEKGIKVLNESIQDHSIKNALSYDVVCAFQVLEHVVDVCSFIESSVACLKTGGLLILSTPSVDSFAALVPNFILDMPPHHVTRWSDISYNKISKIFNLELIELWHEPLQDIHRNFYAQTMFAQAVMRLFRQENLVWNDSIAHKLVSLACYLPAKLFSEILSFPLFHPRGISVTGVFRKHIGG